MRNNLPDANLQIFSFDNLSAAQRINKKISPYLADIFSRDKFDQLCLNVEKKADDLPYF